MKNYKGAVTPAIIIMSVFIVASIGFFLLSKNKPIEDKTTEIAEVPKKEEIKENKTSWDVKIINGEIHKVWNNGESETLIKPSDIKEEFTESILMANVSLDKSKICIVTQSIVPQWVFYANSDGTGITKVDLGKNCAWSKDGQQIAYNNHTTDVSPVDVYVYDLEKGKSTNLTIAMQSIDVIRGYNNPVWTGDDQIRSEFISFPVNDVLNTTNGVSIINVTTGIVLDEE